MKPKHILQDDKIIVVAMTILVFIICVARVPMRIGFGFFPDEPATFAIAAYFSGHNWSEVISRGGYYSYGFALLLLPIFAIFNDPSSIYSAALILNAILASLIVPLTYGLLKRWGLDSISSNWVYVPIFLFTALSGAIIAYSLLGLPEIALVVVAFAITLNFYKLHEETSGHRWYAIQAFLLMYGYVLHQRFLGVLIAGVLVILLMTILRKIGLRKALVFFLTIAVLYTVHTIIKDNIQANLWSTTPVAAVEQHLLPTPEAPEAPEAQTTETQAPTPQPATARPLGNDYERVLASVMRIFTDINRFVSLLRVAVGQMYYMGVASFMLVLFAIHAIGKNNISFLKKIKEQKHSFDYTQMFMLLAFFFTYVISVLFMHSPGRSDGLVYGRYNTIMYLILCLYILSEIIGKRYEFSKSSVTIAALFIGITIYTNHNMFNNFGHLPYAPAMAVDLNFYRAHFNNFLLSPFIMAGIIACLVGLSILALRKLKSNILAMSLISLILLGTIVISHMSAEYVINVYSHDFNEPAITASDVTVGSMTETDLPVYFLRTQFSREDIIYEEIFQYRLFDRPLRLVNNPGQIRHDNHYLVTTSLIRFMSMFDEHNTSFVSDAGLFALFRVGSEAGNNMQMGRDVRGLIMIDDYDVRIDNPIPINRGGAMWTGARSAFLFSFETNEDIEFRIWISASQPEEVGILEVNFSLNTDENIIHTALVDSDTYLIEFVVPREHFSGRHHVLHMWGDTWSMREFGLGGDNEQRGIQIASIEAVGVSP